MMGSQGLPRYKRGCPTILRLLWQRVMVPFRLKSRRIERGRGEILKRNWENKRGRIKSDAKGDQVEESAG